QEFLQQEGHHNGPIDGTISPGGPTLNALAAYLRSPRRGQLELQKERLKGEQAERQSTMQSLPPELRARLVGVKDPNQIQTILNNYRTEKQEEDRQKSLVDAASAAIGFTGGAGVGTIADKMGSGWYNKALAARNEEYEGLAQRARNALALPLSDATRE